MRSLQLDLSISFATMLLILASSACGDHDHDHEELSTVSTEQCSSGLKWTGGDHGSELMHPGRDCMGCHSDEPNAPSFIVAGTVYADQFAQDECAGVSGATVVVEDGDGQVVELETNRAGNFFLKEASADLAMPLKVKVVYEDREAVMQEEFFGGNCHDCHSGADAVRAPPRVLIPQ